MPSLALGFAGGEEHRFAMREGHGDWQCELVHGSFNSISIKPDCQKWMEKCPMLRKLPPSRCLQINMFKAQMNSGCQMGRPVQQLTGSRAPQQDNYC